MLRRIPAQNPITNAKEAVRRERRLSARVADTEDWPSVIVYFATQYRGGLIHTDDIPARLRSDVCAWLVSHPRFPARRTQ